MPKQHPAEKKTQAAQVSAPPASTPRVYIVCDSLLEYQFSPGREFRWRGERVSSDEFVPPEGMTVEEMEARYLAAGAIRLAE